MVGNKPVVKPAQFKTKKLQTKGKATSNVTQAQSPSLSQSQPQSRAGNVKPFLSTQKVHHVQVSVDQTRVDTATDRDKLVQDQDLDLDQDLEWGTDVDSIDLEAPVQTSGTT